MTTTKTSHTPGPWKVLDTSDDDMLDAGLSHAIYDDAAHSLAYARELRDARLIAAAPEMLELVRALAEANVENPTAKLVVSYDPDRHLERARALVAKIEGQA